MMLFYRLHSVCVQLHGEFRNSDTRETEGALCISFRSFHFNSPGKWVWYSKIGTARAMCDINLQQCLALYFTEAHGWLSPFWGDIQHFPGTCSALSVSLSGQWGVNTISLRCHLCFMAWSSSKSYCHVRYRLKIPTQLFLIFPASHFQRKGQDSRQPQGLTAFLMHLYGAVAINFMVMSDFLLKQLCVVIYDWHDVPAPCRLVRGLRYENQSSGAWCSFLGLC